MKIKYEKTEKKSKKIKKDNTKNTNKTRQLQIYIMCKSNQIKQFNSNATRKFVIGDETYVIKGNCCYFKKINGVLELVSFYNEGNPNPIDIYNKDNNDGLEENELGAYLDADLFKILDECQKNDRTKYILPLVLFSTVFCIIQLIISFLLGW